MRRFLLVSSIFIVSLGAVFLLMQENKVELEASEIKGGKAVTELTPVPEAETILPKLIDVIPMNQSKDLSSKKADIPPQEPLKNQPSVIKAIYITNWSAGTPSRIDYIINLIDKTELNAVVIDIKDYSGYVAYRTNIKEVLQYNAQEIRIPKINSLIKKLHDKNIYVIGRVTVFQDPVFAKARPDLAIKDSATGSVWKDAKGLSWMDPASREVWNYNINIAKDAASRGFDEINFDYIRFPSDGNLDLMKFPFYDISKPKEDSIKDFFSFLRSSLQDIKISADLFGLSTVERDDMGIGQIIESAYNYFDYVSPMVYPSHYAAGFLGYKNPAEHPYEIIKYSVEKAVMRLKASGAVNSKLRPWLQDFDLRANYGAREVKLEIKAVYDSGVSDGWMLWDPNNIYTREALVAE